MIRALARVSAAALALAYASTALAVGTKADEMMSDRTEVQNYRLTTATMAKVEKAYATFEAMLAKTPALRTELAALDPMRALDDARPTLAHSVARIDAVPPVAKAITEAGLDTREFVVFGYSLAGTLFASAIAGNKPLPKDTPPATAANVHWYEANKLAVKRFQSEMDRIFPEDETTEGSELGADSATEDSAADSASDSLDDEDTSADSVATE